jgi:hypothetical protein
MPARKFIALAATPAGYSVLSLGELGFHRSLGGGALQFLAQRFRPTAKTSQVTIKYCNYQQNSAAIGAGQCQNFC